MAVEIFHTTSIDLNGVQLQSMTDEAMSFFFENDLPFSHSISPFASPPSNPETLLLYPPTIFDDSPLQHTYPIDDDLPFDADPSFNLIDDNFPEYVSPSGPSPPQEPSPSTISLPLSPDSLSMVSPPLFSPPFIDNTIDDQILRNKRSRNDDVLIKEEKQ